MQMNLLCMSMAAIWAVVSASEGGCAPERRDEISESMGLAIERVGTASATISGWCSSGNFDCSVSDTTLVVEALIDARDQFKEVMSIYTLVAGGGAFRPSCDILMYCDCASMEEAAEFILSSYNEGDYATKWDEFVNPDNDPSECGGLAKELRAIVETYYCNTVNIINALESCPEYCTTCNGDDNFLERVTGNMDVVTILLDSIIAADFCSGRNLTLTCELKATAIANLTEAETLMNATVRYIAGYYEQSYTPRFCDSTVPLCSCEAIDDITRLIASSLVLYTQLWEDFTTGEVRVVPCMDLVDEIISTLGRLICDCSRLRRLLESCPCGEPVPENPTLVFNYFGRLWSAFINCGPNRLGGRCTEC